MIPKLLSSNLSSQVCSAGVQVIDYVKPKPIFNHTIFSPVWVRLETEVNLFVEILDHDKVDSLMAQYDADRDGAYDAFWNYAHGCVYSPTPEVKAAAVEVCKVLDHHGRELRNQPYDQETAIYQALMTDLAQPDTLAAILLIPGATQLVGAMQTAHDAFKAAYQEYRHQLNTEADRPSTTEMKKRVLKILNSELVGAFNSLALIDPTTFKDTADQMARIFTELNSDVHRRLNHEDEEVVEEGDTTPTE